MAFLLQFGPFFHDERKAGQDKMFILTLMLYCTSKSCKIQRLNNNFSRQGGKVSCIGDRNWSQFRALTNELSKPHESGCIRVSPLYVDVILGPCGFDSSLAVHCTGIAEVVGHHSIAAIRTKLLSLSDRKVRGGFKSPIPQPNNNNP